MCRSVKRYLHEMLKEPLRPPVTAHAARWRREKGDWLCRSARSLGDVGHFDDIAENLLLLFDEFCKFGRRRSNKFGSKRPHLDDDLRLANDTGESFLHSR